MSKIIDTLFAKSLAITPTKCTIQIVVHLQYILEQENERIAIINLIAKK